MIYFRNFNVKTNGMRKGGWRLFKQFCHPRCLYTRVIILFCFLLLYWRNFSSTIVCMYWLYTHSQWWKLTILNLGTRLDSKHKLRGFKMYFCLSSFLHTHACAHTSIFAKNKSKRNQICSSIWYCGNHIPTCVKMFEVLK